jgi:hypothetical protein
MGHSPALLGRRNAGDAGTKGRWVYSFPRRAAVFVIMECKDKAVWVIADHTAQPYDGEKRCGQSDDNGRAYLCASCERHRQYKWREAEEKGRQ